MDKYNNENPITLSAKSRRNLYLSTREQIEKDNPQILPEFDRLHNLRMQEFPRLHEFRLGWLCAVKSLKIISIVTLSAWVDGVLVASAKINTLEEQLTEAHNNLVELTGDIPPESNSGIVFRCDLCKKLKPEENLNVCDGFSSVPINVCDDCL